MLIVTSREIRCLQVAQVGAVGDHCGPKSGPMEISSKSFITLSAARYNNIASRALMAQCLLPTPLADSYTRPTHMHCPDPSLPSTI